MKSKTTLYQETTEVTTKGSNSTQSLLNSLIARTNKMDPVMITILQEMLNELKRLELEVFPLPDIKGKISGGGGSPDVINPSAFTYNIAPTAVILEWIPPNADFFYYELRKGTDWSTAEKILITSNTQVVLEPLLIGTHTYLLKSAADGIYSAGTNRIDIVIPPLGLFTITTVVVANAITLGWTIPFSAFRIDRYEIRRNGVLIATNDGTFFAISEQAGGNYVYSVIAVDIAGNRSAEVETNITTTGVTDYIFYAKLVSQFNGIIVNGVKFGEELYFCIKSETYEQHFISNSWNSPQAQINAGYFPWLSPFATTGSYEEVFDFGVVVSNVIVSLNWTYQIYYGNFTIGFESQYSTDGINYSAIETGVSFYASSVRYIKVKMNVTSENDKSLVAINGLSVSLNVKRENDGGEGTSLASDTYGTVVYFKKTFIDVEAITVTPMSETSTFATHQFADTPYPTTFNVKIFDNAGVRITRDFRWNARGIV